jgi:hypothetical protein
MPSIPVAQGLFHDNQISVSLSFEAFRECNG